MRVKMIAEWNTAHSYIPAGAEIEVTSQRAAELIAAGLAEPVEVKPERQVRAPKERRAGK